LSGWLPYGVGLAGFGCLSGWYYAPFRVFGATLSCFCSCAPSVQAYIDFLGLLGSVGILSGVVGSSLCCGITIGDEFPLSAWSSSASLVPDCGVASIYFFASSVLAFWSCRLLVVVVFCVVILVMPAPGPSA